jgi:TonB family protein
MKFSVIVAALASLTLFCSASSAQDVQPLANELLGKARKLSDLRSPNAPAFRLRATFSFIGPALETVHGAYTEIWISSSRWRRETSVNDSLRIEVGDASRLWRLDNTKNFPEAAALLPGFLNMFPTEPVDPIFESITDHPDTRPPVQCSVTRPDAAHQKFGFCFDKKSGILLERIFPQARLRNLVQDSCDYGSFKKTGDYWLPHQVLCFEDRHRKVDATVTDYSSEPSPDPALFVPPRGAIELGNCLGKFLPPRGRPAPLLRSPFGPSPEAIRVMLSLVVNIKGNPQNIQILSSPNAHFDEAALRVLRVWEFKPATCNGEPILAPMKVEIDLGGRD